MLWATLFNLVLGMVAYVMVFWQVQGSDETANWSTNDGSDEIANQSADEGSNEGRDKVARESAEGNAD